MRTFSAIYEVLLQGARDLWLVVTVGACKLGGGRAAVAEVAHDWSLI